MPLDDFGDILGLLLEGSVQFGDLDWPRSRGTRHPTAPTVAGKRVVRYPRAWMVIAWILFIAALIGIAYLAWNGSSTTTLSAAAGVGALLGWVALDMSMRRIRFDSTHVYDRRLFQGERQHAWRDLDDAVASELGGGRLHFTTGHAVRASSHLVGAWLLMEAARRVLRSTGVEPPAPTPGKWRRRRRD